MVFKWDRQKNRKENIQDQKSLLIRTGLKLKNKRGEMKTGWVPSEEKIAEVDTILTLLSAKLEGQ